MLRRIMMAVAGILFFTQVRGQILEGLAGNAQLQREAEAHFMDGIKALMLDKPDDAAKSFEKSLDINNKNAAAHFKLAEIQLLRNQIPDALRHSEEASKLEPKNHYYLEILADAQEMNGDWKNSIKTWRRMAVLPEQNREEIHLAIARIYIDQKKFKEAIDEINQCQKEFGPGPDLFQFRIDLHLKRNDLKAALAEGDAWLKAFPDDADAWYSVCRLYLSNNKLPEAKERIQQLLRRFPDYAAAHLMLADIYLQERNESAAFGQMQIAFLSPDLASEAKIEIVAGYLKGRLRPEEQQQAMELCDLLLTVHPGEARVYIVRGDILNQAGRGKEAREMYLRACHMNKNNFPLWEQIVLLDLNLNEIDSIVLHTTEARELYPNTPSFAFYNGLGLLMQKKYEAAVEALEHAGRISLDNPNMQLEIFSQLGDAYYNLKELDKSYSSYEQALGMDSLNAHVLNNYSYFLSLEKSNLDKAISMSSRLVRLFPEDATYLDTHGWVLYQAGRFSEAFNYLEKAANASGSGVIWEHLGDVQFRLGRLEEAESSWKKAMQLGWYQPGSPGQNKGS